MSCRAKVSGWLAALAAAVVLLSGPAGLSRAAETADPKALAAEIAKATAARSGLCVILGCGDGRLPAELGRSGEFLVHALDPDAAAVGKARQHVQSQGLYGRVSASPADLKRLPYADDLVNVVVADDLGRLMKQGLPPAEVVRVLCPKGTAWLGGGVEPLKAEDLKALLATAGVKDGQVVQHGRWVKFVKPRPADMGEFTHSTRINADGNPLVKDKRLGMVTSLRWQAGPIFPTGEEHYGSLHAAASASGRNFIVTAACTTANYPLTGALRDKTFYLLARDAFNGLLLWQRPVSGSHVLVAEGDRVYCVPEKGGPLVALDAATGEAVKTYQSLPALAWVAYSKPHMLIYGSGPMQCLDAASGAVLWKFGSSVTKAVLAGGAVFCQDRQTLACLDAASGRQRWKDEGGGEPLFYSDGKLAVVRGQRPRRTLAVYSETGGQPLWTHEFVEGYPAGEISVGLADGAVWVCEAPDLKSVPNATMANAKWVALDPGTGAVKKTIPFKRPASTHTGCTNRQWLLTERLAMGAHTLTMVDLEKQTAVTTSITRGGCGVGYMAGNGLLYSFPKLCACYPAMVRGYTGFASDPAPTAATEADPAARLEKGPAYAAASPNPQSAIRNPQSDWPTYRHDPGRSAHTPAAVPADLKPLWQVALEEPGQRDPTLAQDWLANPYGDARLTQPVIVGDTVYVSLRESHRVLALDAADGKQRWSFTAGARLDTPPTIHDGLALVGCRDGWVYCLRADDGVLVWRFRAAPADRLIMTFGQLESPWPVTGGVAVDGGVAYCFAGRSSDIDGGVRGYALEPRSGKVLWQARSADPEPDRTKVLAGICDMPVSQGSAISMGGKWPHNPKTGAAMPYRAGNALSADYSLLDRSWHRNAIGHFGKTCQLQWHSGLIWGVSGQLIAAGPDMLAIYKYAGQDKGGSGIGILRKGQKNTDPQAWHQPVAAPRQVEAMLLAGDLILAAGCDDRLDRSRGGMVLAFSAADGKPRGEWKLPAPCVPEGLAAAAGRLYIATEDGYLRCWGK